MDTASLGTGGTAGDSATAWIGGMAHELGHGLNLPHDGGKLSEIQQFGTTLMGAGNSTYGKSPTYLAMADCAILNDCQVFSTVQRSDWYTTADTKITHLHAGYDGTNIIVSGKFTSSTAVNYIDFYNDGGKNGIGANKDYDAVVWAAPTVGTDSFYIKMPFSEFTNTEDYPYQLRIIFCNENGSLATASYSYAIKNGVPVIDFGDKEQYDKTSWQVIGFSSQETVSENGKASNVIDGDNNTAWVTRWSSNAPTFPHYFVVDMGQSLPVNRFTFTQRNGSSKSKDIEIFVGGNNVDWESVGKYVLPDQSGPSDVQLPATKTFRYFKVVVTSATDGRQYASLAEVSANLDQ